MNLSELEKRRIVNICYDIKDYLREYFNIRSKSFVCLFHVDSKPSARIYDDNKVFCFGCGRIFKISDFIYKFKSFKSHNWKLKVCR